MTILFRHALAKDSKRTWPGCGVTRSAIYRLLCQIKDQALLVLVVAVGHRKDVYE